MNKIYVLFTLFLLSFQVQAQDSCSVSIDSVSFNLFQAIPTGVSPFTYEWSWGQNNTDTISYSDPYPLCVTVTDANGCIATACFNEELNCTAAIYADTDLSCSTQGAAPFTYLWSTGETTESIQPTSEGTYSVTVTASSGCESYAEYVLSCSSNTPYVYLSITDSLSADSTIQTYVEHAFAPITYSWNTGDTTANIIPSSYGVYSVTITDGVGCSTTSSIEYAKNCEATITLNGNEITASHDGTAPFSYAWDTGETTESISILSNHNSYTVTVTDADSCSAVAYYSPPIKSIFGIINPTGIEMRVYLIEYNAIDSSLIAIDSVTISADSSYYEFYHINSGSYLIKAAQLPLFTPNNNFPTYYAGQLFWSDASFIDVSNASPYQEANFDLIQGNNPGGPGFISGYVSEGAGLLGPGDPISQQIVHLVTASGLPVAYTYTDATGYYEFDNIANSAYDVILDIINKEQGKKSVFITQTTPTAKVDFKVNELGVVLSTLDYLEQTSFTITPNPVENLVQLNISTPKIMHSVITLTDILGNTIASMNKTLTGKTTLEIPVQDLSKGIYFVTVSVDNQVLTQKMIKL